MNHTERRILCNIVMAQVASDGGKGKSWLVNQLPKSLTTSGVEAYKAGYRIKDRFIRAAVFDIARYNPDGIHFFIEKDVEKKMKYIVYFDIQLDGRRMQVSFHSQANFARWIPGCKNSLGHWETVSSRQNCLDISRAICGSEMQT